MGTKNNPGKFDCYAAADPDEPLFILRASDKTASHVVKFWVALKEAMVERGTSTIDGSKLDEARHCASEMEQWAILHNEEPNLARAALKEAWSRFAPHLSINVAPGCIFEGSFSNMQEVCEQWNGAEEELAGATVLYVAYDTADYEGSALCIFERNGNLYEVHDSHCSCNGLDNFTPTLTTTKAILMRTGTRATLRRAQAPTGRTTPLTRGNITPRTLPKETSGMTVKARIRQPYGGEKEVVLYHTETPDEVARFAMELIEKHANVAGVDDGEDSAGRHKIRLQKAEELVQRSFDIAEMAFAEARARGRMVPLPDLNEVNAEGDAQRQRDLQEVKEHEERKRAAAEAQKQS